jgi:methylmalonyl-CoA mutase
MVVSDRLNNFKHWGAAQRRPVAARAGDGLQQHPHTLQALCALYDTTNSLHNNAFDEAVTTPAKASVMAI